ncbi:MAG: type II toxin-antitoxin system ParD family antitoxin [Exilibacterium sp.]
MPRTTSVTLGSKQEAFINTMIKSGHYTSTSEVIRDALRKLEESLKSERLLRQYIDKKLDDVKNMADADQI